MIFSINRIQLLHNIRRGTSVDFTPLRNSISTVRIYLICSSLLRRHTVEQFHIAEPNSRLSPPMINYGDCDTGERYAYMY